MTAFDNLPVAVIGGGPVGLATAAHLIARGLPVKVYEAGPAVATNLRDWGHVRVFTPWRYCIDAAAAKLLQRHGWRMTAPDAFPTGDELARDYIEPLAALPEFAGVVETAARVSGISRSGINKVVSRDRERRPFKLVVETGAGARRDHARAVIDASATWQTPNPLGADGLPAEGEATFSERIAYGIPDILVGLRKTYVGKTTLVVGSGHSAGNALLDLARLARNDPGTTAIWATRSADLARIYTGGDADQLPARGELGVEVKELAESGRVTLVTGFSTAAILGVDGRLMVEGETIDGSRRIGPVDRIVAATGQRPDLSLTRELRLELDPCL
jgi:thioredoxin reductase